MIGIPGFLSLKVPIVAKAMVFSCFPCLPSDGQQGEIQADSYQRQILEEDFTNSATCWTRQEMQKDEDGRKRRKRSHGCTRELRPHLKGNDPTHSVSKATSKTVSLEQRSQPCGLQIDVCLAFALLMNPVSQNRCIR